MELKKMLKSIAEAKEEPSPQCPKSNNHEFEAISHMDGRDSYTWVFRCKHCDEYIKKTEKRTRMDRAYWR